jgi:hypothetical protein
MMTLLSSATGKSGAVEPEAIAGCRGELIQVVASGPVYDNYNSRPGNAAAARLAQPHIPNQ